MVNIAPRQSNGAVAAIAAASGRDTVASPEAGTSYSPDWSVNVTPWLEGQPVSSVTMGPAS